MDCFLSSRPWRDHLIIAVLLVGIGNDILRDDLHYHRLPPKIGINLGVFVQNFEFAKVLVLESGKTQALVCCAYAPI